jgi:hypothetical protein
VSYRKDREGRRGGGVIVYVNGEALFDVVYDHALQQYELIILKGKFCAGGNNTYLVVAIYHPPNPVYDEGIFLDNLNEFIENEMLNNPMQKNFHSSGCKSLKVGKYRIGI